jgi:nitric oxide reductase subunit C
MGPDLTNIISDPHKGEQYARIIIRSGTNRMPHFQFTDLQVEQLVAFLKQVDRSGRTTVDPENIDLFGNYSVTAVTHD